MIFLKQTFLIEESVAEINPPEECCRRIYMRNGQWPLTLATKQRSLPLVTLLLDKGADVDMCESGEVSSLFIATQEGNEQMVRLLLERGASVNIKTVNETTPLICASYEGNLALVKLFLKKCRCYCS